jgi:hypothetical protein
MSPSEAQVVRHKKNEASDQLEDEALTDELVEWARAARAAVSDTVPGEVETTAPVKSKQRPRILVVALDGSAADRVQAYLFDDTQEAGRFIETLVETGLNRHRIIVFRSTPIHATYRLVVTIGEPEQQPTLSS